MADTDRRDGEVSASFDPAVMADDARLVFIGTIRSSWRTRAECPRNLRQARERGGGDARLVVNAPWREALAGLEAHAPIFVLYWMHEARRDLVLQRPRHRELATGTFALRSPVRPNPVAMAAVRIASIDMSSGTVAIDAIDCVDGTPLIDIKPWLASVDAPFGEPG